MAQRYYEGEVLFDRHGFDLIILSDDGETVTFEYEGEQQSMDEAGFIDFVNNGNFTHN